MKRLSYSKDVNKYIQLAFWYKYLPKKKERKKKHLVISSVIAFLIFMFDIVSYYVFST